MKPLIDTKKESNVETHAAAMAINRLPEAIRDAICTYLSCHPNKSFGDKTLRIKSHETGKLSVEGTESKDRDVLQLEAKEWLQILETIEGGVEKETPKKGAGPTME
jgi:hypothetical protein